MLSGWFQQTTAGHQRSTRGTPLKSHIAGSVLAISGPMMYAIISKVLAHNSGPSKVVHWWTDNVCYMDGSSKQQWDTKNSSRDMPLKWGISGVPLVARQCILQDFISLPKHMLWVLKRTVSMRQFFSAPKTYVKTDG